MALRADVLAWQANANKELKYEAVVLASDMTIPKRFPSGSLSLDAALGGGWPANQWIEILGRESSGKTAIIFKTIAHNQKIDPDLVVFWLASEHFDTDQAIALGVDVDRVVVSPTQDMELGLQLLLDATASKAFDIIVCDSFPALIPADEDEKAMNEFTTASGARAFNKFWRKMGKASSRAHDGSERPFLGLFVNQWRDKIGGFSPMGTPQTSPGGHGKDYAYYCRVDVSRAEYITENGLVQDADKGVKTGQVKVGQTIKIKTIKNKSAAPQKLAVVDFYFADTHGGFRRGDYDLGKEYLIMGILFGVIERKGAWYVYEGQQWQGKDAMAAAIREDKDLQYRLAANVIDVAKNPALINTVGAAELEAAQNSGTKRVSRRK